MGLFKLLKGDDGKPATTSTTETHEQFKEARVYTPAAGGVTLSGAAPIHQWLMNDGTPATSIADSGTIGGIPLDANLGLTSTTGISGFGSATAVQFNSTDYARHTTDPSGLNGSAVSMAMWINSDSLATQQTLFTTTNDPINSARFRVILETNGGISFTVNDSNTATAAAGEITVGAGWQLVVCTWDGTTQTIAVDAGAVNPRATNSFSGSLTGIELLFVGTNHVLTGSFRGQMDAVYWFDYALTTGDETALYAAGNPTHEDLTVAGSGTPPANGDVVYLATSGEIEPADASDTSKVDVIGFYENTDDSVISKRGSEITGFTKVAADTLVAGDTVYLAKEAGKITNDISAYSTGDSVVKIGKMEDASTLILAPKFMYTI